MNLTSIEKTKDGPESCRLAILMATYNGGKYIREQLESLFSQTYRDWKLYVRDDGSSDETISILNEYASAYANVSVSRNKKSLGAMNNFLRLLDEVDADYYMFCDQDDVWLPTKVERTLEAMIRSEKEHGDVPVTVFSDLTVVDANLSVISPSYWRLVRIDVDLLCRDTRFLGVHFLATGCTMMINKRVKEVSAAVPECAIMHDSYLVLQTVYNGGVLVPVREQLMLYRQHGNNTMGAEDLRKHYVAKRLSNLKMMISRNRNVYKVFRLYTKKGPLCYLYLKLMYFIKAMR